MRPGRPYGLHSHGWTKSGNMQIRHAETGQTGFGFGAAAGGAFVANFAARAGGRTRKRRDRGRMVVRLDFHQDVRVVLDVAVIAAGAGIKTPHARAFDDRGIVGIRDDGSARMPFMRIADHREQRLRLRLAVDHPVGIEDLVPAMLGIGLREHHQFDIGRIALEPREILRADSQSRPRTARGPSSRLAACSAAMPPPRKSIAVSGCGS